MWNIVFIDVNKLRVNFETPESEDTIKALEHLKDNILKCHLIIVIVFFIFFPTIWF